MTKVFYRTAIFAIVLAVGCTVMVSQAEAATRHRHHVHHRHHRVVHHRH